MLACHVVAIAVDQEVPTSSISIQKRKRSRNPPLLPRRTPRAPPGDHDPAAPTLPPPDPLLFAAAAGAGRGGGGPWYRTVLGEVNAAAIYSMRLGLDHRGRMHAVVGAAFPGQAAAALFTGPSRVQVEEVRRGSRLPA
jgi:hypothetical protein